LITFLQKRCQILEAVESAMQINVRPQSTITKKGNNNNQNKMRAISHTMYKCPTFLDMTVPQRIQKVTGLNLCKICLRIHILDKKWKFKKYFKCNKPHNSLLHLVKIIHELNIKENEVKNER